MDAIPTELARQIPQWEMQWCDELRRLNRDLAKHAAEGAGGLALSNLSLDLPQSVRRRIRR